MISNVALIFADAHSDTGADSEFALEQIAGLVVELGVGAVVNLGDVVDKQRCRSAPIGALFGVIDAAAEAGAAFYYIQGNHDVDVPPWCSAHRHAEHAHKLCFPLGGTSCYALDWLPSGPLQEELAAIPEGTDILFSHQAWLEWMGEHTLPQGAFADVGDADTLISGDFHKEVEETRTRKDGGKLAVWSPGATWQTAINEPSAHSVLVLSAKGKIRRVRLKSRLVLESPVLNRAEDLDVFVSTLDGELESAIRQARTLGLPEALHRPRLRYTFSHRLTDAVRRVERAAGGRAVLYPKELPPETDDVVVAPGRKVSKGVAVTPLTELPYAVDAAEEPEVYDLLARTLAAPDPALAFAAWRAEYLKEKGG